MKQSSILAETRHELLDDIAAHTATVLSEHGIDAGLAEQAGHAVADHLANQWRRVSEFLCNRLMSDTVAPNRRHHEQDATSHH
ncbi:Mor transcription activator family protein [Pseudomonas aeruginosa]|uniref:Mor transcription activator family protein n=1 Tax=Pseudomonas aeruginosa TaxID=287 RepID=UPI00209C36F2|nr:Mor transcription activator family protein [Pseudomonas aeruginosa]